MAKFLSLKDHVYQFISQNINEGTLAPEERINEQIICEQLNISRTPVREALIQLAAEGLIDNLPRKGFIVKAVSPKKAAELYAVIGALDSLAASLATPSLTTSHLNEMNAIIAAMEQAIADEAFDIYNKQQQYFHDIYLEQCGNESLIELLKQQRRHFMHLTFSPDLRENLVKVLKETNEEHREIRRLFKEKDPTAVSNYIRNIHWRVEQAVFDVY